MNKLKTSSLAREIRSLLFMTAISATMFVPITVLAQDAGDQDAEAAVFDGVRNYSRERDRECLTFTGGFQWQSSDNVDINFDWTHGTLDEDRS